MSSVIEGNTNEQTKTVYINFSNKQASKHVAVVAVAAVICQRQLATFLKLWIQNGYNINNTNSDIMSQMRP